MGVLNYVSVQYTKFLTVYFLVKKCTGGYKWERERTLVWFTCGDTGSGWCLPVRVTLLYCLTAPPAHPHWWCSPAWLPGGRSGRAVGNWMSRATGGCSGGDGGFPSGGGWGSAVVVWGIQHLP